MPTGMWGKLAKWRTFADVIAVALGFNVWVSMILLPGLSVNAWHSTPMWIAAALPLLVLGVGMWRRSDTILLLGFPTTMLLPIAAAPAIMTMQVYGPVRFIVVGLGLVAYLFGASFFTSFYEPPEPAGVRPLSSSQRPVPERWLRRFRVYRGLTILSVVFPLVLLYYTNFDLENRRFLRGQYEHRADAMLTLLNVGVIGAWLLLYSYVFLGILKPHRTGDRDLVLDLAQIKATAKRGKPRGAFYLGVAAAMGFMLLLLLSRYYR